MREKSSMTPPRSKGSAAFVWDREAPTYDASRQTDPVYSCINQVVQAIPRGMGRCLDAGCGTGLATRLLCARCEAVVAADYSFESLKILKKKNFQNVAAVQADLISLPFKRSCL